jgi:hypothetical protein
MDLLDHKEPLSRFLRVYRWSARGGVPCEHEAVPIDWRTADICELTRAVPLDVTRECAAVDLSAGRALLYERRLDTGGILVVRRSPWDVGRAAAAWHEGLFTVLLKADAPEWAKQRWREFFGDAPRINTWPATAGEEDKAERAREEQERLANAAVESLP